MSALVRSQLNGSIALLHRELLCDLRKAFLDALDEDGNMTDEALSASLHKHRLVILPYASRPRAKPYFIEEPLPHGRTL